MILQRHSVELISNCWKIDRRELVCLSEIFKLQIIRLNFCINLRQRCSGMKRTQYMIRLSVKYLMEVDMLRSWLCHCLGVRKKREYQISFSNMNIYFRRIACIYLLIDIIHMRSDGISRGKGERTENKYSKHRNWEFVYFMKCLHSFFDFESINWCVISSENVEPVVQQRTLIKTEIQEKRWCKWRVRSYVFWYANLLE